MLVVTLSHSRSVTVASYADASQVVTADIRRRGVGASEWYSTGAGRIFSEGKEVAHVSYNGRVWEGVEDGKTGHKEIKL